MRSQTGIVYPHVPDQSSKTKFSRKPSDSQNEGLWNAGGLASEISLKRGKTPSIKCRMGFAEFNPSS